MNGDATKFRRNFWTRYAELYPGDGVAPGWGRPSAWIPVQSVDLNISLALNQWGVGLWLRGRKGEPPAAAEPRIKPLRETFRQTLTDAFNALPLPPGTRWQDTPNGFDATREFDTANPDNWPDMAAWLHYMLHIYTRIAETAHPPPDA